MNILSTKTLSETQKNNLIQLQENCRNHDRIFITFPMEEDCRYLLLYDKDNLLSAMCAFINADGDWECCSCTRPKKRKQGYFTLLLKELLKENGDCDILFPVDESCQDTVNTLKAIDASFWYREHIMMLTFSEFHKTGPASNSCSHKKFAVNADSRADGSLQYHFLMNGTPIGSCLLDFRDSCIYLYGLEINKRYRKQGFGNTCLYLLLQSIYAQPADERPDKIFLQVSGQNLPAMALYKKAGFRITESLSYYVY